MFGRKKGLMWARRSMSAFSAEDRERGMDLLGGAEDVFVTLGAPSRLGTALISTLLTMSDLEDEASCSCRPRVACPRSRGHGLT